MSPKPRRAASWRVSDYFALAAFIVFVAWVLFVLTGCTIAPAPVTAASPALVGNSADGGIIGRLPSGAYLMRPPVIVKYNALIDQGYGVHFLPALHKGDGVTAEPDGDYVVEIRKGVTSAIHSVGNFAMDAEHVADWGRMATQFRSGAKP